MSKYKDLLALGKEAIDAIKAPFKVAKAHKDLEMKILEVEQSIAEGDLAVQEAKSKNPIDLNTVIDKIDSKELLERKLKQLKALESELF